MDFYNPMIGGSIRLFFTKTYSDSQVQWPSMINYSSAIFEDTSKNLSAAQNNKYQKLIDLIKPSSGDKVLEIGCGWGGFAEYLGKKYDVKLDCITISKKQFEYAKERIHKCGLNEKVNILYRRNWHQNV